MIKDKKGCIYHWLAGSPKLSKVIDVYAFTVLGCLAYSLQIELMLLTSGLT